MRPTLAFLAVLLPMTASPEVSSAADSSASSVGEARAHEGSDALDEGDFEAARLAFAQAYAVDPRPNYLWSLAVAESKGAHLLDALGHLRLFLQSLPPSSPNASDDERSKAETLLAEDSARVGHVRVEAPRGARISVDGSSVGTSPLPAPVDVTAGRHALDARLGTESASTVVAPAAGETVVWQLQFERVAFPGPRATAPPAPVPEDARPPKKPPPGVRWLASTGMIVGGLASVAAFGGFLAASSDQNSKWAVYNVETGYCPQPPTTAQCAGLKRAADARSTDQNVAVGFAVTGGALIVAGIVSLIVWPEPHRGVPRSSWTPLLAPNLAGAQWTAQF